MKARVTVTLKTGVLDPQGKAIEGALKSLGIAGVASVRQGKVFDIEIEGTDKARAETTVPQQLLYQMNSPLVTEQAKGLAHWAEASSRFSFSSPQEYFRFSISSKVHSSQLRHWCLFSYRE